MRDADTITVSDGITWIDRTYPIPAQLPSPCGVTGAQELARMHLSAIAAWGHEVTEEAYIEETAQSAEGLLMWGKGPRGIRTECTVAGRRAVIRYDGEIYSPDCYTVTVDGQPQPVPSLYGRTSGERVRLLALTVHRAISD
ncbi:hypothetical protein ACKI14_45210 [Streptomyces turgidiscabies]|uniref:hypothetical protein n=1 Tax=Streptomyces turgidiscabies TaxID=85558 RepID=UPI0038F60C35